MFLCIYTTSMHSSPYYKINSGNKIPEMAKKFESCVRMNILWGIMAMNIIWVSNGSRIRGEKVPGLIVFGDSIVDPGNNNHINTIVKCDFPPYGRDFKVGNPTGRFSNGFIPSDLIAQQLGIKEVLPAYLDPSLKPEELPTGVSFASGASGYDPQTSQSVLVLSLSDQLDLFKEYLSKVEAQVGAHGKAELLSKGLFLVCTGSDDIANTYYILTVRRTQFDINSYTDLLLNSASTFYQELYKMGARKIAVLGLPPIGCVPSQRTLGGGIERKCSDKANAAAKLFNNKLSSKIDSLSKQLPGVDNDGKAGFEEATKGCCGTGNIEVSILCNPAAEAHSCPDASKYLFWDSYHPTHKAYQTLVPVILYQGLHKLF